MTSPADRLSAALAGRYCIERELGAGGMATVYLAEDLKHKRHVALKVLKPELAAVLGAERFVQEITTTASLSHPNILPLFDSGTADGFLFYVMPFIDGETLRSRLNRETQLGIDDAVKIAIAVADALDYAHRNGVIHRDIKPENILLHEGRPMVADFGIALAVSAAAGGRMTETGLSLGTPHYMSPEQATAEKEITARSDVYSLASVLYEMLAGQPPHLGGSAQQIIMKIIAEPVDPVTRYRKSVPPNVAAATAKALEKLPADRFQTAKAFAEALGTESFRYTPTTGHSAGFAPAPDASHVHVSRRTLGIVGLVTAVAAAAIFLVGRMSAPAPVEQVVQLSFPPPDSASGFGRCCGNGLALSPDGRTLVFATQRNGTPLYKRTLGSTVIEKIPGTEGGSEPFFSPDGQWLGFYADEHLKKVSMSGGPALPIATTGVVGEASWGEGDIVAFSENGHLNIVSAAGGPVRALTTQAPGSSHSAPWFLPGGKFLLLAMRPVSSQLEAIRIGVADVKTGAIDTIGPGTKAAYANGYLIFAGADNSLLAQPFDAGRRRTTGQAVALFDRVMMHGGSTHEFAVSPSGTLALEQSQGATVGDVIFLGPAGSHTVVTLPGRQTGDAEFPTFSPDGRRILLGLRGAEASTDLWMLDREHGTLDRFTVGGGAANAWSRDGRKVAYKGPDGIYVKASDGTGTPVRVLAGTNVHPESWTPDGRSLLVWESGRGKTRSDLGVVTVGDTTKRWLVATEFAERHPQLSPDGRWLAYSSDESGPSEVYVQPFPGPGPRVKVSTEGGNSPRWSPDGRTLYYVNAAAIIAAARVPGVVFQVASRKTVVERGATDINNTNVNWDLSPNGRDFLYIDQTGGGAATQLVWTLNWPQMVKAMGTKAR